MTVRFALRPFLLFCLLFIIEVCIAIFFDDQIIRPLLGDVLVVALIFYFVKAFLNMPNLPLAIAVLLFAFTVEIGQYFGLVDLFVVVFIFVYMNAGIVQGFY